MHPPIPFTFRDFSGTLTTHHQEAVSYFVMSGGWVQGQFVKTNQGWKWYPNEKGYNETGFEEYLKTLVS